MRFYTAELPVKHSEMPKNFERNFFGLRGKHRLYFMWKKNIIDTMLLCISFAIVFDTSVSPLTITETPSTLVQKLISDDSENDTGS